MDSRNARRVGFAAAAVAAAAGLWLSSRYSYLLFHSLAELFSIAVAAAMFAVAWNSRRFSTNGYLTYLGIAFLSVAGLDLVHTLAYKGLGVFAGYEANLPTQLWIAARGVESLSLLISPVFLVRRVRPWPTLLSYLAVTAALLVAIFPLNAFPACYVEGGPHPGLTPFKIGAEYVICGILLASMGGLWAGRRRFSPNVLALMIAAIGATILSELAFTRYISVYGDFNMIGHLLKVGSFLLIYKATVEATLKDPYEVVFRDLKQHEKILQENDEALRKERDFVSAVLDTEGALVVVLDRQGRIRRFNRTCEEITGYSAAEVLGRVFWEFLVPPEELAGVRETWEALKAGDFPNTHENHWLARDGSQRLIAWSNAALTSGAGEVQHIIGTGIDITDHKQAEEALLRAKEAWERTFASVPDLIAILDNQYQILRVNEAMARRLGVKTEECIGLRCYEVVHGLSEPPDYCPHSRTIKDGRQHIEEMHEDRLGGDFVVSTTPLHDDKGEMIGTVHVAHDITKRKTAENALQKAHNELEQRVKERTVELTLAYEKVETEMAERANVEEQLRQAHKMEAVGTLAGGIAHDFNNMLAAIIGNTELAMDDVPEEMTARHNLDQIFKAAMRARGLVRQILTFGRKAEHEHKPLSLTPLVKETFKLLRASLPTTIEMRLNIETSPDVVLADPIQIQQVLMNLCTNAADAMRDTGGRFEVSLTDTVLGEGGPVPEAGMQPGAYVTLTVSDTGHGMHENTKSRIFEPFFTTKERGQGTGMGLAVVYGIVKSHQGVITVLSQPGQGATFTVYLPHYASSEKADEPTSRPVPKGKERILFVDDEELLVEMAEGMLGRLGYKVLGKADSMDALRTFARDPGAFDLVLTDHTMPQMTGAVLAQKLKEVRPDIPVILCTGYSETISQEKAESMDIDGFVMKPLSRDELGKAVRRVLDTKVRT